VLVLLLWVTNIIYLLKWLLIVWCLLAGKLVHQWGTGVNGGGGTLGTCGSLMFWLLAH